MDAGTYNVQKATCNLICATCNGSTSSSMSPSSVSLVPGGTAQLTAFANWNTGQQYIVSGFWDSSNTNVATVTNGPNGTGSVQAVAAGTANIEVQNEEPVYGYVCNIMYPCPNYQPFFAGGSVTVQVPTSLSIVAGTDHTSSEASCSAGTGCGVSRSFTYQVNDQNGSPMRVAGLQIWDSISTTSPNNLGLTGYTTTCNPPNTGPCNMATDSNGQFQEGSLFACSTVCRVNNACTTGGPTNANQTWHVGAASIVQSIGYYCDHVTVNGH